MSSTFPWRFTISGRQFPAASVLVVCSYPHTYTHTHTHTHTHTRAHTHTHTRTHTHIHTHTHTHTHTHIRTQVWRLIVALVADHPLSCPSWLPSLRFCCGDRLLVRHSLHTPWLLCKCATAVLSKAHSQIIARKAVLFRVGQNHIYTVHIRYFRQGNHQIYGHIQCIYTVLANPSLVVPRASLAYALIFAPILEIVAVLRQHSKWRPKRHLDP